MKSIVIILIILLVVAGGWYFISSLPQTPSENNEEIGEMTEEGHDVSQPSATTSGSMETGIIDIGLSGNPENQKEFTVNAVNFSFSPGTLKVKKGDHVKITLANTGGLHDLKIDEFNVATPRIQSGQTAVVEFDATKVGSFQYYCSVSNHRAMGMWGTLVVEP